jgi:general secretion pathway protein A
VELLKAINDEFGIKSTASSRKELIDTLNRFLIDQLASGGNAVLIIDECQNLNPAVLEQIRMLSNLETETDKLLQIVMVGQPEFHALLKSASLRQLDERIHVRAFLRPLDEEETGAYVSHRLTVAGSRGDLVFTDGALSIIYDYSRGIPRRINTVCDRCLLIAYVRDTYRITPAHAQLALREIQRGDSPRIVRRDLPPRARAPVLVWSTLAALGAVGVVMGWFLGHAVIPDPARDEFSKRSLALTGKILASRDAGTLQPDDREQAP